jgi:polar amino acid transport system substrate-binding protein
MRFWKSKGLLGTVGVAALILAACGDDDDAADGDGETLTACSDGDFPPMEMEDPDNPGQYTGFGIELAREVTSRAGFEMEVEIQEFEGILLNIAAGDCDMGVSSFTITEERAEQVLFTDPYFDDEQSLLVRAEDADEFGTLDSLDGRTIGVQLGTTGEAYAEDNAPEGAEIRSFTDVSPIFLALESGEVDAIVQDLVANGNRQVETDDEMVVTETYPTGEFYGFPVALDNDELATAINEALAEVREDGTYDELFAEFLGG